ALRRHPLLALRVRALGVVRVRRVANMAKASPKSSAPTLSATRPEYRAQGADIAVIQLFPRRHARWSRPTRWASRESSRNTWLQHLLRLRTDGTRSPPPAG